jgi:hypothetical protein
VPSKLVIVLESPRANSYRYVLWADVPAARQSMYAQVGKVSAWKNASTADNAALAAGSVVESVDQFDVAPGTTLASVQATLQAAQVAYQASITAANPWNRYGTFFDGTSWTAAGLA